MFDPAPRRPDHRPGDRNPGRVIPRPNPIRDRDPIDRIHRDTDHRRFPNPGNAPGGHSPVTRAPHHREVLDHTVNNRELLDRIREHNRWETNRNYYYWHDYGGRRYCHYYDDYGYHWYGWWIGSSYYWTRYHYDRYWWYDPYYGRWVYYYGGSWWWHDPFAYTVVYIYRDGSYYRYEDAPGGVIIRPRPETPAPSPDPAPTQPEETSFYSADGTRMVQIFGDRKDAFLYDLTADEGSAEEKPKFLDKGVTAVSFGNDEKTDPDGTVRQPLRQIELTLEDGSKAVVDPNGTRSVKLLGTDAYLYRLDSDAEALFLAADAVQVKLFSEEKTGTDGTRTSSLELILLTRRDAGGNETLALFDPDGRLLSGEAGTPPADSAPSEPGPAPEEPGTPPGVPMEPNFDGR